MGSPRMFQLSGRWKPQLHFYDRRSAFLHKLDDSGVLLRFRMADNVIEAVIADVGHLQLGPGHVLLTVGSPAADMEAIQTALTSSLGMFVDSASNWDVRVKHIIGLDADYTAARQAAVRAWLQHDDDNVTDFAVLIDGSHPSTGYAYQCEYGVINASEAMDRLSHFGRGAPMTVPIELDVAGIAPVATFFDWNWSCRGDKPMNIYGASIEVLTRCISMSEDKSAMIHRRCADQLSSLKAANRKATQP